MPETWKPPITTGMPAAHNGRAISSARGILVGLHTDKPDKPEVSVAAEIGDDMVNIHALIGFIDGRDGNFNVVSKHVAPRGIDRDRIDRGERVRRHDIAIPANDVAVVVVMRWLDQQDPKTTLVRRRDALLSCSAGAGAKWDQEKFRACFKTLVSLYAFIMAVVNAALFAVVSALG